MMCGVAFPLVLSAALLVRSVASEVLFFICGTGMCLVLDIIVILPEADVRIVSDHFGRARRWSHRNPFVHLSCLFWLQGLPSPSPLPAARLDLGWT